MARKFASCHERPSHGRRGHLGAGKGRDADNVSRSGQKQEVKAHTPFPYVYLVSPQDSSFNALKDEGNGNANCSVFRQLQYKLSTTCRVLVSLSWMTPPSRARDGECFGEPVS
jgi:hypothetical protein